MHRIETNVSLRKFNTFRVNAIARYYTTIENKDELMEIFADPFLRNIDRKLVLGDGSNVLFVDEFFDGLVLHMRLRGRSRIERNDGVLVKIAAGEKWMDLIGYTMMENCQGLEQLVGIPGTVGAAPIQNIGAYGTELSDVFVECELFDVESSSFVTFDCDQCQFGYRTSRLKRANQTKLSFIVTEVTLRLSPMPFDQMKAKEILSRRAKILPDLRGEMGTAGSFFVNPIVSTDRYERIRRLIKDDFPHYPLKNDQMKLVAGWLIEQCGWKGRAGVSHAHSNVLVRRGSKTGFDLWVLAKQIRGDVQKRFQLRLEPEVNPIRAFLPIQTLLRSKVILKKNSQWKTETELKTIEIPADKNVCVHILFAAIALRRTVQLFDGFTSHQVQDIQRILHWIDHYDVAHLHFQTIDHRRTLTISPTDESLPDLTTASFSRASIDMAGSILLRNGQVRCADLGGCQFTKRPIDRHIDLLVALGGQSDGDGEMYHLKKVWFDENESFQFDCRTKSGVASVGVTIHAILSCCALPPNVECLLTSITLELSVQTVIELARQTRPMITNAAERTILFPRSSDRPISSPKLVLQHLPIDQNYLFTICSIAAMFRLKLLISNFEHDPCLSEYLKTIISISTNESQTSALIDGTTSFLHSANEKHHLICDIYPDGLPTDISPILTALFVARRVPFELTDRIYDTRNSQCREFNKLGHELITDGNQILYRADERAENQRRAVPEDFYAHDIRSGVAILLLALHHINHHPVSDQQRIVIHQYEQIERGYGTSLHQQLIELGFDLHFTRF